MRFKRWTIDDSISLSVYAPNSCGIYVLEFANGEKYVGQTRHLLQRFSEHRRRWPGEIVAVEFSRVPRKDLDAAERDTVALHERDGAKLRNIALIGLPVRSTVLDSYVDPVDIEDWLDGDIRASNIGDRGLTRLQQGPASERFKNLSSRTDYEMIRLSLACYIDTCIPYPHRTERRIWVVTCMPSTNKFPGWRRLAAVSINNVEALVIDEITLDNGERSVGGFMNIAPLDEAPAVSEYLSFQEREYGTVGRVTCLQFEDLEALGEALDNDVLTTAARRLAVGLLRKGGSMMAKYHDYSLADDIFTTIETAISSTDANGVE